eukprot:CAMPEP_0170541938 /NCGR_PEP_ID=MMETSP0211-20121228/1529_1 /TAXON_ID=311385 /ORGANISM="Pseudokeronopsis sp., Strain OXSARD2" /LENGTH=56 /DNA_ID=CAMNT_0010844849 /DNA_START=322 /DNA_END=492 /DNA_ORIENTATION=+
MTKQMHEVFMRHFLNQLVEDSNMQMVVRTYKNDEPVSYVLSVDGADPPKVDLENIN